MKRKDITSRDDLVFLVDMFYETVKKDPTLSPMFLHVDWSKHLSVMYDFWDNVLFYTGKYQGNPMEKHRKALKMFDINENHFERWILLFFLTIDHHFKGKNAECIKERAKSIATLMQIKLLGSEKFVFPQT